MVWYGMVWYGMVWYGMVWYGMVWYGMVWYGIALYCILDGIVWYGVICGMRWHCAKWCMVWHCVGWGGIVWYGIVWYVVWGGIVRNGVWYGMVWYGLVSWYGMVCRTTLVWKLIVFSGCLRSSLKILDYYKDVIFLRVLNLAISNSLGGEFDINFDFAIQWQYVVNRPIALTSQILGVSSRCPLTISVRVQQPHTAQKLTILIQNYYKLLQNLLFLQKLYYA